MKNENKQLMQRVSKFEFLIILYDKFISYLYFIKIESNDKQGNGRS